MGTYGPSVAFEPEPEQPTTNNRRNGKYCKHCESLTNHSTWRSQHCPKHNDYKLHIAQKKAAISKRNNIINNDKNDNNDNNNTIVTAHHLAHNNNNININAATHHMLKNKGSNVMSDGVVVGGSLVVADEAKADFVKNKRSYTMIL